MDFNSLAFLLIFLPVSLGIFYLVKLISRNNRFAMDVALLILSLFFYLYKAGFIYFGMMVVLTSLHYLMAFLLDKYVENRKAAKTILIIDVAISVGALIFFKYCGLFNFGKGILFPLALSFTTFQSVSFIVDVYNGKTNFKEVGTISYFLYIFIFVKLTQGPITPYDKLVSGKESLDSFLKGIERFCFGLAKKILIADILATVVISAMSNIGAVGTQISWLTIVSFTLQLYFDFSGYTDMAIGAGMMFGYEVLENFNHPYLSTSIRDFWRRWHITLGTWFRNYVYIPLGGNRKGQARTLLNLSIVFVLTGLWHGSTITFLLWGVFFGIFMVMERLFLGKWLDKNPVKPLNWVYALFVVMMGWVIFISGNIQNVGYFYRNLFSYQPNTSDYTIETLLTLKVLLALIFGWLFATVVPLCLEKFWPGRKDNIIWFYSKIGIGLVLLVVCFVFVTSNSFSPSLYGGF